MEGGESEPEDITEDNMTSGTCTTFFPANQTATTSFQNQQNQASRRVAPVMGNRGLESQRIQHERSRSKSKVAGSTPKEASSSRSRGSPRTARKIHHNQENAGQLVAALDERNLKRAVNRYGTMPKGARIGAYLESLRQSGMTPEPITEQGVESDAMVDQSGSLGTSESMDRSMVGKPNKANQMLRSNSSHGGFSSSGAGSANLTSRNSPSNSLVKRVQQGSLERAYAAGAASSVLQNCTTSTTAPDFEFPPPPADLPPPCSSPSPRSTKRNFDKENLPERLERTSSSSKPSYQIDNSPMSPLSENRTLGSPAVGSLSSPGSTLDHDHKRNTNKSEDAIKPFQQRDKIKADHVVEPLDSGPAAAAAPADMLVNELFESFKAKSNKAKGAPTCPTEEVEDKSASSAIDFKANLRKVKKPVDEHQQTQKEVKANQIDFKSNLKKKSESGTAAPSSFSTSSEQPALVDFKAKLRKSTASPSLSSSKVESKDEMDQSSAAAANLDFKARLRKVSDSKDSSGKSPIKDALDSDKKAQEKRESGGSTDDDKRKSTGSISSLRKMWESTTPKAIDSPDGNSAEAGKSTVKFEKRVWPPVPNTETEKPMVPVKPTVKPPAPTTKPPPPKEPMVNPPPKPAMAVKPNVCNIYAAPTVVTARAKPPIASRPTLASKSSGMAVPTDTAHSGSGSGCSSSAETSDKEELLGISHKLESSIGKKRNLPSCP